MSDPTPDQSRVSAELIRAVILPGLAEIEASRVDPVLAIRFLLRHWLVIGVMSMAGAVAAVAASYLITRVYRSEILVAPVVSNESSGGIGSLLGKYGGLASAVGLDVGAADAPTVQALAQLTSRAFIEQFISDKQLMPVLFAEQMARKEGKKPTLQDAYLKFVRSVLLVKQDKATKLVTLQIDWTDRELTAVWANELIARINAETRADAIRESERSLEYLRTELQKADFVTLRESISSVIEAQVNKRMLAQTRPDYSFHVIDPAKASDLNKPASPRRVLFAAVGLMLGFSAGVGLCVWLSRRRLARAAAAF